MNIGKEYKRKIQSELDLADEFAIRFYRWMMKNDTMENADKWFGYTDYDMLEAYKQELLSSNKNVNDGDETMMNPGLKRKDSNPNKIG